MGDKNTLNIDNETYLELLKHLKNYLKYYYFKSKNIICDDCSIIYLTDNGVSYFIYLNMYYFLNKDNGVFKATKTTTINMNYDDFDLFMRIVKLEKIKNKIK